MKLFITILLFFYSAQTFSHENILTNKFNFNTHSFDTTNIPYRMFTPKLDGNSKLPLVIALHGAGERGTDNEVQIKFHGLATVWVDSSNQAEHPCFVVAPQCPKENKWVDVNWGSESFDFKNTPISNELETVMNLIDSLIAKYPIDEKRIYLTGLSMGGFGSWYLLMNSPNKFAAAIIMSGSSDPSMACEIKDIPIWNFHGDLDKAVPIGGSRNIINAISNCEKSIQLVSDPNKKTFLESKVEVQKILSANHIYTEYAGKGHAVWTESYNNWLVREWLFSKK